MRCQKGCPFHAFWPRLRKRDRTIQAILSLRDWLRIPYFRPVILTTFGQPVRGRGWRIEPAAHPIRSRGGVFPVDPAERINRAVPERDLLAGICTATASVNVRGGRKSCVRGAACLPQRPMSLQQSILVWSTWQATFCIPRSATAHFIAHSNYPFNSQLGSMAYRQVKP